ncbi:MAG TPA: hypothetical protein VL282_16285, partial [Tepidisphaeraceae bacterium]|nr:hypothetical protein [Tepidisphaeraceae bacterium]
MSRPFIQIPFCQTGRIEGRPDGRSQAIALSPGDISNARGIAERRLANFPELPGLKQHFDRMRWTVKAIRKDICKSLKFVSRFQKPVEEVWIEHTEFAVEREHRFNLLAGLPLGESAFRAVEAIIPFAIQLTGCAFVENAILVFL